MMATVPHDISGLGLRKFQADGFLLTRVYITHTIPWISELCSSSRIPERKRFGNLISYRPQTLRMRRYKTAEVRWLLPPLTSHQSEIKQSSASSLFTKIHLRCPITEHLLKWVRKVELLIIDNRRPSTICTQMRICQRRTARK